MSRSARATVAALLIAGVGTPLGAQPFEGTVAMRIARENGSTDSISYLIRNGRIRFDRPGGQISVIIDPGVRRVTVIMNAQRMYMEREFDGDAAAAQGQAAGRSAAVVRTGRMETIAGYRCEHVTVTDDDGTTVDSCLASELGGFRMPAASDPMAPQREAGWISQTGTRAFPLKAQKGGKVILEVIAIERKPLDASLFAPPEGYQSFAMPVRRKPPPG